MAKDYWVRFGSKNPADHAGLAPTFVSFINTSGQTLSPPGITEPLANSGLYHFSYHATQSVAFTIDGATTGLADSKRYITGVLDPHDRLDQAVGSTASTFGSTSADPGTLYGYLKRIQEYHEGDQVYSKSNATLDIYNRGQSTLLRQKTIADGATSVTKS